MLRVISILAALLCIVLCIGLPSRGGEVASRRLVWASDDEEPQVYKYEVVRDGRSTVVVEMIGG